MPDGLVDVHAHFTTGRYVEAAKAAGHREPDGMPEAFWPQWTAERHLELMDRTGVATTMLSISSPGVHFGDDAAARTLAAEVNDAGAEIVRAHPGRFGLFASLPAPDTDGALEETARAFDELGASGVILLASSRGAYLGDARLAPLLAELDRRRAVLFLHPNSAEGHAACGRPRPMMEFLFETARSVVDFVLSGHAGRYPGIRLVVPHMGGVLPLLAARVELFRPIVGYSGPAVAETLRGFHYDLAGAPSAEQLTALASIAPPEHLLYGSDYAWTPAEGALRAAAALDTLTPGWRALTTRNAHALLGPSVQG